MRAFVVVLVQPLFGDVLDLLQRLRNLNAQCFAVDLVNDVQHSELAPVVEHIMDEVQGTSLVDEAARLQRHTLTRDQVLLGALGQVQSHLAVHPPQVLVVDAMTIQTQSVMTLPKAPAGFGLHNGLQHFNHLRIFAALIGRFALVRRP